ncbi:MAG: sigma-70 family RNA polymerase sigma factor, partial [Dehalococcoidia bacterium]
MVIEADPVQESDAQLIAAIVGGDTSGYRVLYERHERRLLAILRASLPPAIAEEAAQEAWARAYERLPTLGQPQAFFSWLLTIARNYARDHHRTTTARVVGLDQEHDWIAESSPSPETAFEQSEDQRLAAEALNRLPEKQRNALILRNLQGKTSAYIAGRLGVTIGAIDALLHRARANFLREFNSLQAGSETPVIACYKMRSSLRALNNGHLSELRRRRVLAHLGECQPCRATQESLGRVRRSAGFLPLACAPFGWLRDQLAYAVRTVIEGGARVAAAGGAGASATPVGVIAGGFAVVAISTTILVAAAIVLDVPLSPLGGDDGNGARAAEVTSPASDQPLSNQPATLVDQPDEPPDGGRDLGPASPGGPGGGRTFNGPSSAGGGSSRESGSAAATEPDGASSAGTEEGQGDDSEPPPCQGPACLPNPTCETDPLLCPPTCETDPLLCPPTCETDPLLCPPTCETDPLLCPPTCETDPLLCPPTCETDPLLCPPTCETDPLLCLPTCETDPLLCPPTCETDPLLCPPTCETDPTLCPPPTCETDPLLCPPTCETDPLLCPPTCETDPLLCPPTCET